MKNKVLIGGLMGGVAFFLLGWLIYGILLKDFLVNNFNHAGDRGEDDIVWWALIVSNLINGYFLALILGWSNTSGMSSGLQKGAVIGLLMCLGFDLGLYAFTTMYNNYTAMIVDVAAYTVMSAVVGGIIGWYMGMGKQEA